MAAASGSRRESARRCQLQPEAGSVGCSSINNSNSNNNNNNNRIMLSRELMVRLARAMAAGSGSGNSSSSSGNEGTCRPSICQLAREEGRPEESCQDVCRDSRRGDDELALDDAFEDVAKAASVDRRVGWKGGLESLSIPARKSSREEEEGEEEEEVEKGDSPGAPVVGRRGRQQSEPATSTGWQSSRPSGLFAPGVCSNNNNNNKHKSTQIGGSTAAAGDISLLESAGCYATEEEEEDEELPRQMTKTRAEGEGATTTNNNNNRQKKHNESSPSSLSAVAVASSPALPPTPSVGMQAGLPSRDLYELTCLEFSLAAGSGRTLTAESPQKRCRSFRGKFEKNGVSLLRLFEGNERRLEKIEVVCCATVAPLSGLLLEPEQKILHQTRNRNRTGGLSHPLHFRRPNETRSKKRPLQTRNGAWRPEVTPKTSKSKASEQPVIEQNSTSNQKEAAITNSTTTTTTTTTSAAPNDAGSQRSSPFGDTKNGARKFYHAGSGDSNSVCDKTPKEWPLLFERPEKSNFERIDRHRKRRLKLNDQLARKQLLFHRKWWPIACFFGLLCALLSVTSCQQQQQQQSTLELSRAVEETFSTPSYLSGQTGSSSNNNNDDGSPISLADLSRGINNNSGSDSIGDPISGFGQLSQTTTTTKSWLDIVLVVGRIFVMGAIIVGDICGNSLVILSVCRHSKLRVTTNWFVVSLACADILVALFAMTFNASLIISGRWLFPRWVCDFWNSCDVLASTASILHLCCISIDRYIAIMRPLDYPMKITTRRVMWALCAVWVSSALLSYIPIFTGIYTTPEHAKWIRQNPDQCDFVVNQVYAIVSSSISFWIPCCIMVFTYYRIYREATRQEKFIFKAQSIMPAPMPHHHHHHHHQSNHHSTGNHNRAKQRRSKSMAVVGGGAKALVSSLAAAAKGRANQPNKSTPKTSSNQLSGAVTTTSGAGSSLAPSPGRASSLLELAESGSIGGAPEVMPSTTTTTTTTTNTNTTARQPLELTNNQHQVQVQVQLNSGGLLDHDDSIRPDSGQPEVGEQDESSQQDEDKDSGQSTPTKRSISKMKREHKAAKTLGIIMGVFILCWLPFFSWYTPIHICGESCKDFLPAELVTLLFWIGYFNSTLNPIIYAYFNHEFRDAFKKTLQWIFCCCQDLKCLRVNRANDNQHYNCTYRSTQEIKLVSS